MKKMGCGHVSNKEWFSFVEERDGTCYFEIPLLGPGLWGFPKEDCQRVE